MVTPVGGLTEIVPQLEAARCDLKVLVAHTIRWRTAVQLAKKFPVFDLLVTAGGAGDPTLHPEVIEVGGGRVTSMIQVGVKGMYVGIVGFYENDGQPTIKYQRVPLDERFEDSSEMKEIFIGYQNDLKRLWLAGQLDRHQTAPSSIGSYVCWLRCVRRLSR